MNQQEWQDYLMSRPFQFRFQESDTDAMWDIIKALQWSPDARAIITRALRLAIHHAAQNLRRPRCPACQTILNFSSAGVYVCPHCYTEEVDE